MIRARALTSSEMQRQQEAAAALQAGRWQQALSLAQSLAAAASDAPDSHLLHAMCLSEAGDDAGAADAFVRAAALAPGNPVILVNQAHFLRRTEQLDHATRCARQATQAAPQWVETWTALGSSLMAEGESDEACLAFAKALQLQPGDAEIAFALVCALRESGRWQEAEALARRTLGATPSHAALRFAWARWLREAGRAAEALALVDAAPDDNRGHVPLADLRTGLLLDAGRAREALANAHSVVEAHPFDPDAHSTLCMVRWEHDEAENDADEALRRALRRRPGDAALRLAWVKHLLMTQQPGRALSELQLLHAASPRPMYLALIGDACHALGRLEKATTAYEAAYPNLSDDPAFLNSFARHCLRIRLPERAAELCQRVVTAFPHDQQAWAWLGVAWRLLDDPREHWLCDYGQLVAHVEVPWGEDATADVPRGLRAALDALHEARRAPANQSLRDGSQTAGKLFGPHRDRIIREVESHLRNAVHRHLADLPHDPKHPFLSRNRGCVRMQGSWSVRLHSSGNHVNHVHPDGWCSSAYYVALPASVAHGSGDAGALQLGQPPVDLDLGLAPRRIIHPREGCLALFPSYVWHGTVPFEDEDPRITIAFDMLPSGANESATR